MRMGSVWADAHAGVGDRFASRVKNSEVSVLKGALRPRGVSPVCGRKTLPLLSAAVRFWRRVPLQLHAVLGDFVPCAGAKEDPECTPRCVAQTRLPSPRLRAAAGHSPGPPAL